MFAWDGIHSRFIENYITIKNDSNKKKFSLVSNIKSMFRISVWGWSSVITSLSQVQSGLAACSGCSYQTQALNFQQNLFYLLQSKPFKNDEKCFLFHLKSSFCSQDIKLFVLTFWSCIKNGLIKKIKLISKSLASQPSYHANTIHILSNI